MPNPRDRCRRLMLEAEGYLELGMYEHALRTIASLEAAGLLEGNGLYLKGEALRSLERFEEAINVLRQAADFSPDDIHILLALGWCYKRTARLPQAIEMLEDALLVEPGEALVHYNLACYWSLAGDKSRSLGYLSGALDIDSSYRDLIDGEGDFDSLRGDPDFLAITSVIV